MDGTEIAIVGLAGRFPGARDVDEFWHNLRDGVESITFFTDQELESMGVDRASLRDPQYVKAASVIADQDAFDAAFFGINHREAQILDPQHRVLLECAWSALEHAGYDPAAYDGTIGVYAGATINTYLLLNLLSRPDITSSLDEVQLNISNGGDFLTTRISYKLNLKGPSHTVQSACSTSLVAIHLACQSLLGEECDMALAGGVSINVKHRLGYRHLPGGMTSPDGHCRAFDSGAQGTIFGNGAGLVVLKRLEDALAERDCIYAIIKGSAINNDGSFKIGYTAPSVDGQAEVITEALANACVNAGDISYVEAHGTGTPLGDPIEIQALTKAFRASTDREGYCAIGSVKTNFGHLDAAAGVTGLIKTVCALKHKMLPPSLHFVTPNPAINFASSPFYVNAALCEWQPSGEKRRAGVSAFGVGGTNAHIILEEPPARRELESRRPAHLLTLSARSESALQTATGNLAQHLKRNQNLRIADVAHTLQIGRRAFEQRCALVCRNVDDAISKLENGQFRKSDSLGTEKTAARIVYLFSGQGAQRIQMGKALYDLEPVFRKQVDVCSSILISHIGSDLRSILYADQQVEEHKRLLNQTRITQPALFTIEYALAQLWMDWGVKPAAMLGHSIGEYVAACLAGVFSLEDALALVSLRGRLMEEMPQGAMLALRIGVNDVQPLLGDSLSIAAINADDQVVVSGPPGAIAELERYSAEHNIFAKRLETARAFHSKMLDPTVQPYVDAVKRVRLRKPNIKFVSNVTGKWMTDDEAISPEYWGRQLREAVRFSEGITEIVKWGGNIFLEVGPGETLKRLVSRRLGNNGAQSFASLPPAEISAPDHILNTLGGLWCAGVEIDFRSYYKDEKRNRVALPSYPFERTRYWIEPGQEPAATFNHSEVRKRNNISDWFYMPVWKPTVAPRPCKRGALRNEKRKWAIFNDELGIGAALADRLKQEDQEVVIIRAGRSFRKNDATSYTIDPASTSDYLKMVSDLVSAGNVPEKIVHLWSVNLFTPQQPAIDGFRQAQERGCYSLFSLAYALSLHDVAANIHIQAVSNDTASITREESLSPEKATILGACRVIPQEVANLTATCIDLRLPHDAAQHVTRLADQLLAEIILDQADTFVAYRMGQRYVQSFDSVSISTDQAKDNALREGGTYLLVNALTSIGFHLARHLAATARPNLILIEESALPPRELWQNWLSGHDDREPVSQRIRNAMALESAGANVFVASVDITNSAEMRCALTGAGQRFGALNGVIYATEVGGKTAFKTIREICEGDYRKPFETKAFGLMALRDALPDVEMDFAILSSSLSSVMGGLGSAISACANIFTDCFATAHNQTSDFAWTSINWDAWQLEQEREQISALSQDLAQLAMTPAEGREVFQRILTMSATKSADQFVISTAELAPRMARWSAIKASRNTAAPQRSGAAPALHPRPQLDNVYVAPVSELERHIASVWQQAFAIEQVGIDDNFFDLGGESLIAIQVASQLKELLRSDVPVTSLYETLTIRLLARLLESEQGGGESLQNAEASQRAQRALNRKNAQEKQRLRKKESAAS
jgi:acyl transferase domain-containing protein